MVAVDAIPDESNLIENEKCDSERNESETLKFVKGSSTESSIDEIDLDVSAIIHFF